MAKEVAIGKRAKISEAQQYMLLSVLIAAIFLGVAISLTSHFVKQIMFNMDVISAQDESIANYSKIIKETGACPKPSGDTYSDEELKKCDPNNVGISQIPGTLRSNILEDLAANSALNSVPSETGSNCRNPETGKNYTYNQLKDAYIKAQGTDRQVAMQNIKSCSALRVIPDALPSSRNEEALLSSLNQIFNLSNWKPESLSPSGSSTSVSASGLGSFDVNVSVEAGADITTNVLSNIERSIREFDISRATFEWSDKGLTMQARASAYYMTPSKITETTTKLSAEGSKK